MVIPKIRPDKIILFLITSIIISYVVPGDQKFFFYPSEGRPWTDPTLIAPFNFPVYKTDQEYKADCERSLANVVPFYRYEKGEEEKQINTFHRKYEELLKQYQPQYPIDTLQLLKKTIIHLLRHVYDRGIRQLNVDSENYFNHNKNFYLIDKQQLYVRRIDSTYTQKTAYDYINEKLSEFRYHDLISSVSLFNYLSVNLTYDQSLTDRKRTEALNNVARTKNFIATGEVIVKEGEMVTPQKHQILQSLSKEYLLQSGFMGSTFVTIIAKWLLTLAVLLIFYLFLLRLYRYILLSTKSVLFLLLLFLTAFVSIAFIHRFTHWNIYVFPIMIFPVFISSFFDSRVALNFHVVLCTLLGIFIPNGIEYFIITLATGIATIHLIKNIHLRNKLYRTAVVLVIFYSIFYTFISLLKYGSFHRIDYLQYLYFLLNGILIVAIFPFTYILEKLFGISGNNTLLELCDTNYPLLRKLSEIAPATFQHSMQVANLAEAVTLAIGGNPLLARAGALYHDIGKMNNPTFFIENQDISINIHHNLEYSESAKKILQHVQDGEQIARQYNLAPQIVRFIKSHHGTTRVLYFYNLAKQENATVSDSDFTYPGPLPTTKEEVVVMMADAIEAASRAMENKNMRSLITIVEQVIEKQMNEKQYFQSDLSFRDVEIIKNVFKRKLQNIYHNRRLT